MSEDASLLAAKRKSWPGESADYADARAQLLAEEIKLQRQIDHVANQRRALPPGPVIETDYRFIDMNGTDVSFPDLFDGKTTLVTYFWMYGPDRERPCPMCTNLLGPLNANADDLKQRVALAVLGRSSVERQIAFGVERDWHHLPFYQTVGDQYALDFGGLDPVKGWEYPVLAVFRKDRDGQTRLFWKGEMTGEMADKGKDPRGGPDLAPLWTILDMTPEGRGEDWYPKLSYS
jgi:predicted dithiol-disulfide oxidoreductase (DUF899 family)